MPTKKMNAAELSNKLLASFKSIVASKKLENTPVACDKQPLTAQMDEKKELHPYLKAVKQEQVFKLKTSHGQVVAEVMMLEGLCESLKKAPGDAIVFHMNGRNDFAAWIKDSIGDWWLGSKVEKVELKAPEDTRNALVRVMEERIYKLRNQ
jgi:DNA-binding Xre family transcriptional regulator